MERNILQTIANIKRREVEAMKKVIPGTIIKALAKECTRRPLDFKGSLLGHDPGIIAEHKRRSPSKGEIYPMSDVENVAKAYASGGAAAMSVLTDTPFFGGSPEDLAVAREAVPELPLLRKEFIVDEWQIYQARILGADAILLIASMLRSEDIIRFNDLAHLLGLQTLVEIHSEDEAGSLPQDADMAGVNNRDLTSFHTDIGNAARLFEKLPERMVKIAESGIRTPEDMMRLKSVGFDGFLIGEAFMKEMRPGDALRRFTGI